MGEVGAYLSTVDEADRDALQRVYAIAREVVPDAIVRRIVEARRAEIDAKAR